MKAKNLMSDVSEVRDEGSETGTPGKVVPPSGEKSGGMKSYISYPLPTFSKIKGFYG
jgi:hypothetical protein